MLVLSSCNLQVQSPVSRKASAEELFCIGDGGNWWSKEWNRNDGVCVYPKTEPQDIISDKPVTEAPITDTKKTHETWSVYGEASFIATANDISENGSDLFTDPSKGALSIEIKPTEKVCLLQFGTTSIHTDTFTASFGSGDTGAGFRVIAESYWKTLSTNDGAYNLCWTR